MVLKKVKKSFLKKCKYTKPKQALKGFASTYNVDVLNSFNHELQLKDIQSAITS